MEHNAWTDAETYLLVERLTCSSTSEDWQEVVEQCDNSETFKLESYRLKAIRKYAISHNLPMESVEISDVEGSPQGLAGWAEMQVSVPGIEELPGEDAMPSRKRRAEAEVVGAETGDKPGKKPKAAKLPKEEGAVERKKASSSAVNKRNREVEKKSKDMLCLEQRACQVMEKFQAQVESCPAQYAWAKPLLEEFATLQENFKGCLCPAAGDDLSEFVNELRLTAISPVASKNMKKNYKDNYHSFLTVFVDRCGAVCQQTLVCCSNPEAEP